nr:hypothetical protein [Tanacetum cinerariifolium]
MLSSNALCTPASSSSTRGSFADVGSGCVDEIGFETDGLGCALGVVGLGFLWWKQPDDGTREAHNYFSYLGNPDHPIRMRRDTVQLETAVSTISQEYLLEFTSEYGILEALHPELPGPEDRIVDFLEGK